MEYKKILIFSPTYNEKKNIPLFYQGIKSLNLPLEILFVDDNSPDGTGREIDNLCKNDSAVHVIHRNGKLGTGTAFICAYDFACKHNFDYMIAMDADLTHDPKYIPAMLKKTECADIVIGSRYTGGGKMSGWTAFRLPFTLFWKNMIKLGLGMPFDATGAFRLYRVNILKKEIYTNFHSKGFSFQMESIYRFKKHGARIAEVPIHAQSRIHGTSKLSTKIMRESALEYFRLLFDRLFNDKEKKLLHKSIT